MNIKTLLYSLNPSRKVLIWLTAGAIASIPTIWVVSSRITTEKITDDNRLTNLETSVSNIETSVKGLYFKFDEAETRFKKTYKNGVTEVGDIIKESDKQQTEQLKFIVENLTEENKLLISAALELRQDENESNLNEMIDKTINDADNTLYGQNYTDVIIIPEEEKEPNVYSFENATMFQLDSISKEYKILIVLLNEKGNYNLKYRDYTVKEKESILYFNRQ